MGLSFVAIMGAPMSSFTVSDPKDAFLSETDFTAVSFWIISIAMIAATVFFYAEAATVSSHWKTSLHVHARVLGRRWQEPNCVQVHRLEHHCPSTDDRVQPHPESRESTDWPSWLLETLGWHRLHACLRLPGETKAINPWIGFFLGMCGWAFILFEIFAGESAQASGSASEAVKQSFNNMRIIVSLGWAIYPAGYFLGQINDSAGAAQALNVTYNIADFVNKIAFVLACWSCAKTDTEAAVDSKKA